MREYLIFTDSSADFDQKKADELKIEVIPMSFIIDGTAYANYPDEREFKYSDFYAALRSGSVSSTCQLNTQDFIGIFKPYLEKKQDILYIALSSGLSGTVDSANAAAKELMEEFSESKVLVIDSLAASLGEGLMVYYAAQLKKQGKSIEEVFEWVIEHRLNFAHWFTVDDLMFLRRGGRLSGTVALVGTMLGIKPILHVDNEGHLINISKIRGRNKSLDALVECMQISAIDPSSQTVFISHGDCFDDAKYLADEIRKRFKTKDIYINYIGPVIGSHSGPGTVALFFFSDGR